jgi:hypothetical protein
MRRICPKRGAACFLIIRNEVSAPALRLIDGDADDRQDGQHGVSRDHGGAASGPPSGSPNREWQGTLDRGVVVAALSKPFESTELSAVKFSPTHSNVELRVERRDSFATFRVRDKGIGIRTELLPYIFERFRSDDHRYHRGLGLGLAIASHIVELHTGDDHSPQRRRGTRRDVHRRATRVRTAHRRCPRNQREGSALSKTRG